MTLSRPFRIDLTAIKSLDSISVWTKWLDETQICIPIIPSEESHVLSLWLSYQEVNQALGNWMVSSEHTIDEMMPMIKAFNALQSTVFVAIIDSEFDPVTISGLTVILWIQATVFKYEEATREEYQLAFQAAASIASKLTHQQFGVTITESTAITPITVH